MDLQIDKGLLFKNKSKTTDAQPDYSGEINVKGTIQRISGWVRKDKNGETYLGLSCSDPRPTETGTLKQPIKDEGLPF